MVKTSKLQTILYCFVYLCVLILSPGQLPGKEQAGCRKERIKTTTIIIIVLRMAQTGNLATSRNFPVSQMVHEVHGNVEMDI